MSLITYRNRMMNPGVLNFLNDVLGEDLNRSSISNNKVTPAVNVKETDNSFELEVAVPGLKKKDINIDLEDNVLKISSLNEDEKKEEKDRFKRREFHYHSFERSFTIPEDTDENKIDAKHENGVLFISIPKKEVKPNLKKLIKIS